MTTHTRSAATVAPQPIAEDMHGLGFVAVAIGFPEMPTAHRVARVTLHRDQAPPTVTWTGDAPIRHEVRAACQATADVADPVHEMTAETADTRGAVACPELACFGGTP